LFIYIQTSFLLQNHHFENRQSYGMKFVAILRVHVQHHYLREKHLCYVMLLLACWIQHYNFCNECKNEKKNIKRKKL